MGENVICDVIRLDDPQHLSLRPVTECFTSQEPGKLAQAVDTRE